MMRQEQDDANESSTLPGKVEGSEAIRKEIGVGPGDLLGRFRIEAFLGYGGMGCVYKAYDPTLQRYVALKVLRLDDPENISRFSQEARAQAKVAHANICEIYEVSEWEGRPYIAMRYVQGTTLAQASPGMTIETRIRVMKEVAEAVQEAHKRGLIHRDLKPTNVMVERNADGEWIPYVMDFGLAKDINSPAMTATGILVGTPSYMAPEQAKGEIHSLDRRTDVYSLGATLYELLCGEPPFVAESTFALLVKVLNEEPVSLKRINRLVQADLETIVMKCLEKDPARRYDSAKALSEDLQRYLNGEPILARPAGLAYRSLRWMQKRKALVGLAVFALLVFVVLGTMYISERVRAGERARLAQQFGLEVNEIEATMRRDHLAQLHNTEPARNLVREKMAVMQRTMETMGKSAFGPGYYSLGRGYLSLGETGQAEIALKKAWETYGYRGAEVAYALGLVLAQRYQEKMSDRQGTGQPFRNAHQLSGTIQTAGSTHAFLHVRCFQTIGKSECRQDR